MNAEQELSRLRKQIDDLEENLAASKVAFVNVVGKNRDGALIINEGGNIVYANKASIDIFGRNLGELIGEKIGIPLGGEPLSEINVLHKEKGKTVIEISVAAIEWDGEAAYLASLRDVSERKKVEDRLAHMSKHDFLTDLPNRFSLEATLKKALARAARSGSLMAVLYLDLDNFKKVNDTLGHDVGDELLINIAKLLLRSVRETDSVYRLGGDEFAIILDGITRPADAANVAKKIIDNFASPQVLSKREFYINTSIGIAVFPYAGESAFELIKSADVAMYNAKRSGKGQYQYFTQSLNDETEQQFNIDTGLHLAIERNEFFLVYQPQLDFDTGTVVGFEALLRWRHPEMGVLAPIKFLSIAEESGLIIPIGTWVLHKALEEFAMIKHNENYVLNVNLSFVQLQQADITHVVFSALKNANISPERFGIELTESVLMREPEQSIKKVDELANAGIAISIDDYGTGYSSLTYLKKLTVSYLKIDQSFVKDILIDPNDTAIVCSTISLAHQLGIQVVAEGVETQEQFAFLKEHGCDIGQGYFIAKPKPFDELVALLDAR